MLRRPVTLSLLLLSAPAAAQAVWVERAARPFARSMAAAAWDPVRGRMVVFGGSNNSQLGDTWVPNRQLARAARKIPAYRRRCAAV